ncbi:P-loop containing nucleoside triphosphate hydrolase protein [Aaosphaeria arxii CBS 175.79]|uniref:P-loop containing nucleoside triphosphate hydrolase protein n=1 Tax=Aaosphaeria arxii CBS 175.79 TaxID=1450172 RepID=A0A6A5Y7B9_9PLEO|nr:P-loop containing nucleoside triphosphate hydrolase protein [Aaosphaeria arxii CBS 175.79]KAF2020927.1 P-loop containing nucleoside triphosphate hydrolase protein [Aaosphaeria arxii CBS 175.79]
MKKAKTHDESEDFPPPDYLVAHQVTCSRHRDHISTYYEDVPRLLLGDWKTTALHGTQPFTEDIFSREFAEENPHISFIAVKSYDCGAYHEAIKDKFKKVPLPDNVAQLLKHVDARLSLLQEDGDYASIMSEIIVFVSSDLQNSLSAISLAHPEYFSKRIYGSNVAPILDFYHARSIIESFISRESDILSSLQLEQLRVLVGYIRESRGDEFDQATAQFAEGAVGQVHFCKLFSLGDIVVRDTSTGPLAYQITNLAIESHTVRIDCFSWDFNGEFFKSKQRFTVHWPSNAKEVRIETLEIYPLRYSNSGQRLRLEQRGSKFWNYRERTLVDYEYKGISYELRAISNRFMIDMDTYRNLHPVNQETRDEEDEGIKKLKQPPNETFVLLLPSHIRGYGFHDKKWSLLLIDQIRSVTWSSDTFDRRLVLKAQKKEIIKALITVHTTPVHTNKADIVEGKGNGLIMLLHGGPGTGKTLTAESIAEFAERPLYKVTCGDIGTDAESVEKYLESVLYIGTLWKCVVLLDEADVFLEERTPTDLQRNALVSVFLRVLEYFEGILILTSNRVGTFDEAFKSRVQLAMHYPSLDENGRWEVWHMFLRDLLQGDEQVKYTEIKDKLDVLARYNLNGRQIRNVFNTARQLARYRKEHLAYSHFDQALEVVNEFEEYLVHTRGHTDEEYAKAQGHR